MINPLPGTKFWILTLVNKKDLWANEKSEVEAFYSQGEYADLIEQEKTRLGSRQFRHEIALGSLMIRNFETGTHEMLRPNTAGYDQVNHAESFKRLIMKSDELRIWKGE